MASLRRKLIETLKTVSAPIVSPIYGIKRALNSTDPAWERTDDAVGLVANAQDGSTAVYNDFDSIYPWSDIISYNYDVTNDTINAYYGDNDFAFNGSNGDVLTLIPEFYYKRWQDGSYEYIQISKNEFSGSTKSEEFSIGRYLMSGSSSRVYSRSGYAPLVEHTISEFRTYVNNLSNKFSQLDWHLNLIQILYLVEYANYNSQEQLGKSYCQSNRSAHNTGGCDFLGMKSGSYNKALSNYQVCYRGIEDVFGNLQQFVDGINVNGNDIYVCYDKNKYTDRQYSGDYNLLGYTLPPHVNGYIKKIGYDSNNPLIMFCSEVNTSSSTGGSQYITDGVFFGEDERILVNGGKYALNMNETGLFMQNIAANNVSAGDGISARFIKLK